MQAGAGHRGREKPAEGRRGRRHISGQGQGASRCRPPWGGNACRGERSGRSRTTSMKAARARCAGVALACMGWVNGLRQGGCPAKGFTRVAATPLLPTPPPSSTRLLRTFVRPTVSQEGKTPALCTLQATPLDTNHPPAPAAVHCPSTRLLRTFLSSAAVCTGDASCGRKAARRGTCTAGSSWAVPLASLASKGACS